MNIVLSNDDGYFSKGIKLLYEVLKDYGQVYLVAPHKHMSGASVSRVFWTKVKVYQHDEFVYSVDGTPADAVSLALHGLNIDADVVISGINAGFNVGADTVYSGTVGACMEALKFKVPAIAMSADYQGFDVAKKELRKVLDYIFDRGLISKNYLLNVNFPSRKYDEALGIQITDLGFRPTRHFYVEEDGYYVTKRKFLSETFTKDTDLYAVNHGYVSITPLKFANQTNEGLNELRNKVKDYDQE